MKSIFSFSSVEKFKEKLDSERFHRLGFRATGQKSAATGASHFCSGELLVSPNSRQWLKWEKEGAESRAVSPRGNNTSRRSHAVYLEDLGRLQRKHILEIDPTPDEFSMTAEFGSNRGFEQMIRRLGAWCTKELDADGITGVIDRLSTVGLPLDDYLARRAVSAESMLEGVDSLNRLGLIVPVMLARKIRVFLDLSNQIFDGEGKGLVLYSPIAVSSEETPDFVFTDEIAEPKARLGTDGHEEVGSTWLVTEDRRQIFKKNGGFGKVSKDFAWTATVNPIHLASVGLSPGKQVLVQCPLACSVDFHAATKEVALRDGAGMKELLDVYHQLWTDHGPHMFGRNWSGIVSKLELFYQEENR